ncbi:glycosyltransferase family 2 protein [Arsenicicoccus piscis]|uniref:Glycosyl transferase group 2 family protein n=1 Tax=Arsenicicoccus piscis TaxID=673954 RepID=A0ABQ6HQ24_9MICO|nr:glycosyltransferase family 2 protein [Arsenicicoccus piscis]GMA20270.1 glycosyl transferase group 2 family protein [Arsenicicoccus piscis]
MPRISVIMPTYRRPHLLQHSLGSVVAQTFDDPTAELEVLVCDNGNDPETAAVVERFDDPRVTYVPRPRNLGMVGNAIDGFRRATGDLVVKLDDDDVLYPAFLQTLTAPFADRPRLTVAFSDHDLIDSRGRLMIEPTQALTRATKRDRIPAGVLPSFTPAAAFGSVHLASAVLRRDAIDWDAIPDHAGTSYDYHLVMSAAADGHEAFYSPERLMGYRIHGANDSTRNIIPSLEAALAISQHALDDGRHTDPGASAALHARMSQDRRRIAREYLLEGRHGEARANARASLLAHPTAEAARVLALSCVPQRVGQGIAAARRKAFVGRL